MKFSDVARFEKVSTDQFMRDLMSKVKMENYGGTYLNIKLPRRGTNKSAGYDFYSPVSFSLEPNESIVIPSGIKCCIDEGWFLSIFPRSSLGFKYLAHLPNTVGIIDGDYYNNDDNEGHIMMALVNGPKETLTVKAGDRIAQGIFLPYGLVTGDIPISFERSGGFGSTGK